MTTALTDTNSEDEGNVYKPELLDAKAVGNLIGGYQTRRGYARVPDLVNDIQRVTGIKWHENTIYNVIRGERLPNLELLMCLILTLRIPMSELEETIDKRLREDYRKLVR